MTKAAAPGIERGREVGGDGVAARGLDDDARRRRGRPARGGRRRRSPDGRRTCRRRARRARQPRPRPRDPSAPSPRIMIVVHVVVPSIVWRGRRRTKVQGMKKPRSPSWCRGPWSLRSLEAPVRRRGRAVRAPGPVPPGRAARASSWTRPRRCGGSYAILTHNVGVDATISRRALRSVASRVPVGGTVRGCVRRRPVIHIARAPIAVHRSRGARLVLPVALGCRRAHDGRLGSGRGRIETPWPAGRRRAVTSRAPSDAGHRRRDRAGARHAPPPSRPDRDHPRRAPRRSPAARPPTRRA